MHTLNQLRTGELSDTHHLKLACGLTQFPREILSLADTLEILDLSGNRLSELPDDLVQLKQLRVLFCSNNQFTALPDVLGQCPKLTMIGFKANRIRTVSAQALPPTLRWLILTDNAIEAIPPEIGQCTQLQKLMLAGNQLKTLPKTLAKCQRLELIRLAVNQLNALPPFLLDLPRLAWLAYAGNPFSSAFENSVPGLSLVDDIPWHTLALDELLGEGASGLIYRAHYTPTPSDSSQVAVKMYKGAVTSDGLPSAEMSAAIHAGHHPNLIQILGKVYNHPTEARGLVMALISPAYKNLAEPPSLASCTRDIYPINTSFKWPIALQIAHAIAEIATHLHQRGIMHGDLYGHNILHNGQGQILLGDFGAASHYPTQQRPLAERLEKLEVRAFGYLLEELTTQSTDIPEATSAFKILNDLKHVCLSETPAHRPLFKDIVLILKQAIAELN